MIRRISELEERYGDLDEMAKHYCSENSRLMDELKPLEDKIRELKEDLAEQETDHEADLSDQKTDNENRLSEQKTVYEARLARQKTDYEAKLSHQKGQSQEMCRRYGTVKLEKGELEAEVFRLKHDLEQEKKTNAKANKVLQGIRKTCDRLGKSLDGRGDEIEKEKLKGTSQMPVVVKEEPEE
jgi:chromosome segregation ATPase